MMHAQYAVFGAALFAVCAARADAGPDAASPSWPADDRVRAMRAARAAEYTLGLDFDEARRELAGDAGSPMLALERGRLAIYEGDFDGAVAVLSRSDVAKSEEGAGLLDLARSSARASAATLVDRDEHDALEVRYQDEYDRPLTPFIAETVIKARDLLTRELGVSWPKPTRVFVVRDLLTLSAVTGLPYEAARTTGTVAVAKWGRVTLLSPRASRHGYPWRDTVAHELTHLAITRASQDRAPLWLQEGLAKREEIRWRDAGPFDRRPPPEAVVARGMKLGLDLPLDKFGPSIAMLPSADAAMVAFAEASSFISYFIESASPDALPRVLLALRNKKTPDEALKEVSGFDLKGWDGKWRAQLRSDAKNESLPPSFNLGADAKTLHQLRERERLGELLVGRGHPNAALKELDQVRGAAADSDPSYRYVRARALEEILRPYERDAQATAILGEARDVMTSYGPWWAIRGRWARARADVPLAETSFEEALSADPLDIECVCQTLDISAPTPPGDLGALCEAARRKGEPGLGED